VSVVRSLELVPIADPADPDDWRPRSRWGLVSDPDASLAVIVEEIAPGDRIPLHRHEVDEVLIYESGAGEIVLGTTHERVVAGSIAFVPARTPHSTINTGDDVVRVRAVFPSHVIDIEYLERNPAPGTEEDPPQPPVAYDARAGAIVRR
jgi:quercetin dioxygenase-like cupin family protein